MIFVYQSIFRIIYIGWSRPLLHDLSNNMMLFGECIVLLTGYNMFVFTDFLLDAPAKVIMGNVMITITVFGVVVYLLVVAKDSCTEGTMKGRKRYLRCLNTKKLRQ
jgi:hypothetical protein